MLRAGNRRTILPDSVDLNLKLVRLVASILVLHEGLLEVLRRVEVPGQLLAPKLMQLWLQLIL